MATNEKLVNKKMPPLTDADMRKRIEGETGRLGIKDDGTMSLKKEKTPKMDKKLIR